MKTKDYPWEERKGKIDVGLIVDPHFTTSMEPFKECLIP